MKARLGLALSLALLLPLFGCTDLPVIEAGVCGNAVIEEDKGEDCDSFAPDGQSCRPPGVVDACRFDCRTLVNGIRAVCPEKMGCDDDGICRSPAGNFEKSAPFAPGVSSWLTTADFDGDQRLDVISTEVADDQRLARFRIHYFGSDATLQETRTFPRVVTRPIARRLPQSEGDDLIFSNGLIGMVPGRKDREWIPAAFSSYVLPGTRLRAVPVQASGVTNAIGLAIFSDLDEGPGVYVPSLDDQSLLLSAPLKLPFEDLAAEPVQADIVDGPDSPCSEVVYAFLGDDSVHVLDLCERGTVPYLEELLWRTRAIDHVVRLPQGEVVTTAPQVADFDADGHLDVLVGSGNQSFVAHGNGSTLEPEASPLMLHWLESNEEVPLYPPLASGDFTGDGFVDFVMATGVISSYTSRVDGKRGYFEPLKLYNKPWSMAIVTDLNGNGFLDVIAATSGSPGLSFLSGTGTPFPNLTPLSTQGPIRLISVGDFDGDRVGDVAYVEGGPDKNSDDSVAISFGQRDALPLAGTRVAQMPGVLQLGSTSLRGGSSIFTVSHDELDGVKRSKFTLFDGSPDRLPFAAYSLVTFSVNGSLESSAARVLTAGAFTAPGASDLFVVGGNPELPETWSMWLVPGIGGSAKPPQLLVADTVPPGAVGLTINVQGGQLSAAAAAADLEGDHFDEALVLMPRGEQINGLTQSVGCYLMIYDLDAAASTATSKGFLTFDELCPEPEIATADLNGDKATDLLVLIGDPKLGPRQLRLLFNDGRGEFSVDDSLLVGVEGHDVRSFSAFTKERGRLAIVTDDGLYQVRLERDAKEERVVAAVTGLQDFFDARSVVVTNPDGDNIEDLAVADAAGVWLLRARLE